MRRLCTFTEFPLKVAFAAHQHRRTFHYFHSSPFHFSDSPTPPQHLFRLCKNFTAFIIFYDHLFIYFLFCHKYPKRWSHHSAWVIPHTCVGWRWMCVKISFLIYPKAARSEESVWKIIIEVAFWEVLEGKSDFYVFLFSFFSGREASRDANIPFEVRINQIETNF
jgi:hypothetical protein